MWTSADRYSRTSPGCVTYKVCATYKEIRASDAAGFVLTIAFGLYLDQTFEIWGQIAASVLCWAVLLAFMQRTQGDLRLMILACLVWSTGGELIASMVWGLYLYRLYNVPEFIPPGHALMMLCALYVAARIRLWLLIAAPAMALLYAAYASWRGIDMLSVVVTPVFLTVVLLARARKLYAATFLLALPLEFYGTWLGNWRWEPYVPGVGLSMANPPVCIGAIYCARDALAAITVTWIRRWRSASGMPAVRAA